MFHTLRAYKLLATARLQTVLAHRIGVIGYMIGKILRMGFFLVFAIAMFHKNKEVAGFNAGEIILFYAMMNMFDVVTQMLVLRGFSNLPRSIANGTFDMMLTRPINILGHITASGFDLLDFFSLPGVVIFIAFGFMKLGYIPSALQIALGILVTLLSFCAIYGTILIIASCTFVMREMHNLWWFYRDLTYAARNPQEFFPRGIQLVFTYLIPIFVIITYPTRAFIGVLSLSSVLCAAIVAVLVNVVGIYLWRRGLRSYSSAG